MQFFETILADVTSTTLVDVESISSSTDSGVESTSKLPFEATEVTSPSSEEEEASTFKEDIDVDVTVSTDDSQETTPQIGTDSEDETTERVEVAGTTTEKQFQTTDVESGDLFVSTEPSTSTVMAGTDLDEIAEAENVVDVDDTEKPPPALPSIGVITTSTEKNDIEDTTAIVDLGNTGISQSTMPSLEDIDETENEIDTGAEDVEVDVLEGITVSSESSVPSSTAATDDGSISVAPTETDMTTASEEIDVETDSEITTVPSLVPEDEVSATVVSVVEEDATTPISSTTEIGSSSEATPMVTTQGSVEDIDTAITTMISVTSGDAVSEDDLGEELGSGSSGMSTTEALISSSADTTVENLEGSGTLAPSIDSESTTLISNIEEILVISTTEQAGDSSNDEEPNAITQSPVQSTSTSEESDIDIGVTTTVLSTSSSPDLSEIDGSGSDDEETTTKGIDVPQETTKVPELQESSETPEEASTQTSVGVTTEIDVVQPTTSTIQDLQTSTVIDIEEGSGASSVENQQDIDEALTTTGAMVIIDEVTPTTISVEEPNTTETEKDTSTVASINTSTDIATESAQGDEDQSVTDDGDDVQTTLKPLVHHTSTQSAIETELGNTTTTETESIFTTLINTIMTTIAPDIFSSTDGTVEEETSSQEVTTNSEVMTDGAEHSDGDTEQVETTKSPASEDSIPSETTTLQTTTVPDVAQTTVQEITQEEEITTQKLKMCIKNGMIIPSGKLVDDSNPCKRCVCENGEVLCSTRECPPKPEGDCTPLPIEDGECCPKYSCITDEILDDDAEDITRIKPDPNEGIEQNIIDDVGDTITSSTIRNFFKNISTTSSEDPIEFTSSTTTTTTIPTTTTVVTSTSSITSSTETSSIDSFYDEEVYGTASSDVADDETTTAPEYYADYPNYPDEQLSLDDLDKIGPGACLFDGKVYVSAQQIPRDNPCDFCFCFRGDIICLQQSCPPPIPGCREEIIGGFCCPRYECPVKMATHNVTIPAPTTQPSLSSFFFGSSDPDPPEDITQQISGCEVQGNFYETGAIVEESSSPCLQCR